MNMYDKFTFLLILCKPIVINIIDSVLMDFSRHLGSEVWSFYM